MMKVGIHLVFLTLCFVANSANSTYSTNIGTISTDKCIVSAHCEFPMFQECKNGNCDLKPWVLYAIGGFAVFFALILTMCLWCPCCCVHKCLQNCHICPSNDEEEIEPVLL